MISEAKLDFWIKAGVNVLLKGERGVGKTSMAMDAFKRMNMTVAYFSAATMDPFVDFVGIPTKVKVTRHRDGVDIEEEVIRLTRPEYLINLHPDIIFMDELNRAHKKTRNAVMELIQFGTINGVKFSDNLKAVWAAVNPDNSDGENEYDTDRLDPAQLDRFEVQVEVPFECDLKYFTNKYPTAGKVAVDHWNAMPKDLKKLISPRRLDMALQMWTIDGDMRDVMPKSFNPTQLLKQLELGPIEKHLSRMFSDKTDQEAVKFFADPNKLNTAWPKIVDNKPYLERFLPLMPQEHISKSYSKISKVQDIVSKNLPLIPAYEKALRHLFDASLGADKSLRAKVGTLLDRHETLAASKGLGAVNTSLMPHGPHDFQQQLDKREVEDVVPEAMDLWLSYRAGGFTLTPNETRAWWSFIARLVWKRHDKKLPFLKPAIVIIEDLKLLDDLSADYPQIDNFLNRIAEFDKVNGI
jgi:hypothetical protein